jgi:hypothetical protein
MPVLEAIVLRDDGIRMDGVCLDPISGVKIPAKGLRGSYPVKLRNNCDLSRQGGLKPTLMPAMPAVGGGAGLPFTCGAAGLCG